MVLVKESRLSRKKDFDFVFKKGKRIPGKFLIVYTAKNDLNTNRFGVIVSNKISKKAVERNKIRRKISEVLRKKSDLFKKSFDNIVVAKKSILGKSYREIEEDILGAYLKGKMIYK